MNEAIRMSQLRNSSGTASQVPKPGHSIQTALSHLSRRGASRPNPGHETGVLAGNGALMLASYWQYTWPAAGPRRQAIMSAKRSTQAALWIGPDDASASGPIVPAGAVLASELVFHQLAFEALAVSIARAARTRESVEGDRAGTG
jgi:hypothetical protein